MLNQNKTLIHKSTISVTENLYNDLGPMSETEQRYITVHYAPLHYTADTHTVLVRCAYYPLDINPDGTYFFNVDPMSVNFKKMFRYVDGAAMSYDNWDDYFSDQAAIAGTVMTPEVRAYLDTKIQEIQQQLSATDSIAPVSTLSQLHSTTNLVDQRLMFVEQNNAIYSYDQQSTAMVDNDFVIASYNGIGRWLKVDQQIVNGGTF